MKQLSLQNYGHPGSHPPSIITQDANNRFVTDVEKATWNNQIVSAEAAKDAAESAQAAAESAQVIAEGAIAGLSLATLAELRAITAVNKKVAFTSGRLAANDGGGGKWVFLVGDYSTQVAADTQSGVYVAPNTDLTGVSGAWVRQYQDQKFPEWYGLFASSGVYHLYVATTGDDTNSGLTLGSPFLTIQAAADFMGEFAPYLYNTWQINLAAGEYNNTAVACVDLGTNIRTENPIYIVGPDVGGHPNVPTALIKGATATESGYGIRLGENMQVYVKDVKIEDFNGSTASAGISAYNRCQVYTENAHFEDCYSGIAGLEWCELDIKGGIFNDCGYLNSITGGGYGVRTIFNSKLSIGTQNQGDLTAGPNFTNNYFGVFAQENCDGHIDWCTFDGNSSGVRLTIASRANCDGSNFINNGSGIWASDLSIASPSANTTFGSGATANTQNIIAGGGSSVSTRMFDEYSPGYASAERCIMRRAGDPLQVESSSTSQIVAQITCLADLFRETYSSLVPAKKLRMVVYGSFAGTNNAKRVNFQFGSTQVTAVFTASEVGTFVAEGTLILGEPDKQYLHMQANRHLGTGVRSGAAHPTEALTSDTVFQAEVSCDDNNTDTVTVNAYEIYVSL